MASDSITITVDGREETDIVLPRGTQVTSPAFDRAVANVLEEKWKLSYSVSGANQMGHIDRILLGEKLVDKEQEFIWLWIFATTMYGVGDMVTTITILEFEVGVEESNLLLKQIFDSLGQTGLIGLKLGVFFVCLLVSLLALEYWDDWPLFYAPPLILIALGTVVTANNLYLFIG